jgi:hypothetical protein
VVLVPSALFYFKLETDAIAHGGVDLHRAIIRRAQQGIDTSYSRRNRSRGVVIETPLRTVELLCNTEADRERWLALINSAVPPNGD